MQYIRTGRFLGLVLLLTLVPTEGRAQLTHIGGHLGYSIDAEDVLFGAAGLYALRQHPKWVVNPTVDILQDSEITSGIEVSASIYALNFDGWYVPDSTGTWRPYVGGGLALWIIRASVDAGLLGTESASDTQAGLNLTGGMMRNTSSKTTPFVQLRLTFIDNDTATALLGGILFSLD